MQADAKGCNCGHKASEPRRVGGQIDYTDRYQYGYEEFLRDSPSMEPPPLVALVRGPAIVWYSDASGNYVPTSNIHTVETDTTEIFIKPVNPGMIAKVAFFQRDFGESSSLTVWKPLPFLMPTEQLKDPAGYDCENINCVPERGDQEVRMANWRYANVTLVFPLRPDPLYKLDASVRLDTVVMISNEGDMKDAVKKLDGVSSGGRDEPLHQLLKIRQLDRLLYPTLRCIAL